jgi:hypothetical protein
LAHRHTSARAALHLLHPSSTKLIAAMLVALRRTEAMLTTANYASLIAITPSAGDVIYMQGYYSDRDGGEGIFVWNATSTATPNAGTIVKATALSTGRWFRPFTNSEINVKWFGAKGDFVQGAGGTGGTGTDDTDAIAAAVAVWKETEEARLIWPSGNYQTTEPVNFVNPFSEMVGIGRPCITYNGTVADNVFSFTNVNNRAGMKISGIDFDGGANARGVLYIHRILQSVFEDICVRGCATGYPAIQTGACVSDVFRNITISKTSVPAGQFSNTPHNGIILGFIEEGTNPSYTQTANCTFINLVCEWVVGTGAGLANATANVFIGGTSESNGAGVQVNPGCFGNKFDTFLCEDNNTVEGTPRGPDFYILGDGNILENCGAGSGSAGHPALLISGNHNQIVGGTQRSIANTGDGNRFDSIRVLVTGGWADAGTNTGVINAYNTQTEVYYTDRPAGVIYRDSSAQSYTGGGSFVAVAFNNVNINIGGIVDGSYNVVIPQSGVYDLGASIYFSGGVAAGDIAQIQIVRTSGASTSVVNFGRLHAGAASDFTVVAPSRPVALLAGDTVTVKGAKTGSNSAFVNGNEATWLAVSRRL